MLMYKPKMRHWKSTLHVSVISLPLPNLTLLQIMQWKLLQCKWKISILITMNLVSHPHRHSMDFVAQSILTNVCFHLWLMDQSESVLQLLVNLCLLLRFYTGQDQWHKTFSKYGSGQFEATLKINWQRKSFWNMNWL